MEMRSTRTAFALSAVACWVMMALLIFVIIPLGTFVVPMKMVPEWKAQGLKEAPLSWQLIVDANDFAVHRWFVVFPALFIISMVFTVQAVRRHQE